MKGQLMIIWSRRKKKSEGSPPPAAGGESTIWLESLVATRNREPYVRVTWQSQRAQWTPDEAREHAARLLQTANAAESDAFIVQALMGRCAIEEQRALQALVDFRKWRSEPATKAARVSIPPVDHQMETAELRAYAGRLLVMAEAADAQAFLIGYLVDRVGIPAETAGAIVQEYADYFEQRRRIRPDQQEPTTQ